MKKFSIILIHYNQMKYIEEALLSILNQDYDNIELIVSDDCSSEFNKKIVKDIIDKNNKKKFEYKILDSSVNRGTVKNLNVAMKAVTGDFVLFFAADDKLSNEHVISHFVEDFNDDKKNIITAQAGLYGNTLDYKLSDFVDSKLGNRLNTMTFLDIYERMCEGCFYAAGSTAYRTSVFQKYGLFNEEYKYVEDWSYWLYVTRNGEMMYYSDFDALCHRDGGISHSDFTPSTIPPHVRQYYIDIINIYDKEVLPYLDKFKTKQKYRILKQFNETLLYYMNFVPSLRIYLDKFDSIRLDNKKLKYYWKSQTIKKLLKDSLNFKTRILNVCRYNKSVPITFVTWFVFCLFYINNLSLNISNDARMCIYLALYTFIYIVTYFVDKISLRFGTKFPYNYYVWVLISIILLNNSFLLFDSLFLTLILLFIISNIFVFLIDVFINFLRKVLK